MVPLRLLAATLLAVASTSCTSYELVARDAPPSVEAAPLGTARICVVRPHEVASLVPAIVRDNGQLVGMTKGPSYFCYLAEPGQHTIVTRYGDDVDAKLGSDQIAEVTVTVEPRARLFLHHDVTKIMSLSVRWVDPTEANKMIGECDYVELKSVPTGEVLPEFGRVVPSLGAKPR